MSSCYGLSLCWMLPTQLIRSMLATMVAIPDQYSPRRAALDILQRLEGSTLHADDLIDQELSRNRLQGADRGLLTELVFGVLRHQGTLDHYLRQLVQQPLEKLEQPVLLLLRLGLHQLRYLDRIPAHAAVHASVELAKQLFPRAKGMVNGVLRSYLRRAGELSLPDPEHQPAAWLAATYSLPEWLADQWLQLLPREEAAQLGTSSLKVPPITLRTNSLRISREVLLSQLQNAGIAAEPCHYAPGGIRLLSRGPVMELPGFHEGFWTVQDEASQLVSLLLDPQPGEQVLDMCAAPGGKTTHLAQLMGDRGQVTATDLNQRRIRKISESAERLDLTCIQALAADALQPAYLYGRQFDRVLLDAPCSGLGVIRRNPEAKWRLTPAEVTRCALRQRLLLETAVTRLKPGGVLVYATCSTAYEEDEAIITDFLSRHPAFVIEDDVPLLHSHPDICSSDGMLRTWPHRHGCDGFFAARLKRIP